MKTVKYLISTLILIAVVWSCTDDEFGNSAFIETAVAPTDVAIAYAVTTDNTGTVTIAPSGNNAVTFEVHFGDSTPQPVKLKAGESVEHIYPEGSYEVKVVAYGITGLKTEATAPLTVSFVPPTFGSDPEIYNSESVSNQVFVHVPDDAENAVVFDVLFEENGIVTVVTGNVGETVTYTYANPGLYDIKVVLKGAAIATAEYTFTAHPVVEIVAPVVPAPAPGARDAVDVISIYGDHYASLAGVDMNPDWGQGGLGSGYAAVTAGGDDVVSYTSISYQGVNFNNTVDVSNMEYLHLDLWTHDLPAIEVYLINGVDGNSTENFVLVDLVPDEWNSIDIPISAFTDQGLSVDSVFQFKFVGSPWLSGGTVFVDNLFFWKEPDAPSPLIGTWMVAPENGAIAVGPSPDDLSWWYLGQWGDDVTSRACWLDDEYVFNEDGSFQNILGSETWLETWQGVDEGCGAPVAPHDGTSPATWSSSDTSVTISGVGAYLALPKAHNNGEDGMPVNDTITYDYVLSEDGNTLEIYLIGYGGTGGTETWYYKLIKKPNPLVGTWKVAAEVGAIAVGPTPEDLSWWFLGQWGDDVTDRACWLDDEYIFSADGTFTNSLGESTWLETWQGVDEGCGTPVAPHDGSNPATWSSTSSTVTVTGEGAYLALPKAHNNGEDGMPINNTITYEYELSEDGNTLEIFLIGYGGTGGSETWYYKMVKQ